ncbi:hypothetical protein LTS08_004535 [Lithohypha guttulata]|nr:hypothetical protein LTS08_004535 [Lithohypha guttulata]
MAEGENHTSALRFFKLSLPETDGESSLLLQMPSEVMQIILRELLIADNVLGVRDGYPAQSTVPRGKKRDARGRFTTKSQPKNVRGYHLTPAILATSQRMLREGLDILYLKNRLGLQIQTDTPPRGAGGCRNSKCLNCYVLSATIPARADERLVLQGNNGWETKPNEDEFVHRFKHLDLSLLEHPQYFRAYKLRPLISQLAPSLVDKCVQVSGDFSAYAYTSFLRWQRPINQFQLLRCRDFKFQVSHVTVKAVEEVVTSQRPVIDLERPLQTMRLIVQAIKVYYFNRGQPVGEILNLYSNLDNAMYDFDVQKFSLSRRELFIQYQKEIVSALESIKDDDEIVEHALKQEFANEVSKSTN